MSNIAVVPQINLPANIMAAFAQFGEADDLDRGVSSGFPIMSIRGAKWRISEGGEETPITIPGTNDLSPFVKVVLLRANGPLSKTFYAGQYVEGTDAKPDCASNDGIAPSPDSPKPQCTSCAACPQNVWGSKISPSGAKIKACADVRRMAILPSDDLDYDPILLRVPGASLGDLAAYGKALKQRGIPYAAVVTKLSFDPDASYPKIMFQFERVLTPDEMNLVVSRLSEPSVDDVLGLSAPRGAPVAAIAAAAPAVDQFNIPATITPPATVAAVVPDAELEQAVAQVEQQAAPAAAAPTKKPRKGFGGPAAEPAAAAAAVQPQPSPTATAPAAAGPGDAMLSDIDAALASLQF